jgi:proline iminopeptidase
MRCCTLLPDKALVLAATSDESSWTLARHEAHYMAHDCFLSQNQILDNCDCIRHIPTTIVHGRYDIVCPFDNAWLLHEQLPGSELVISESSGHSASQAGNKSHLIGATQKMLSL